MRSIEQVRAKFQSNMTSDKEEIFKKTFIGQILATFGYGSKIPTASARTEKLIIVNDFLVNFEYLDKISFSYLGNLRP